MVNAILAAIFSFIIPGSGQAYAGDINRGLIIFTITLLILLPQYLYSIEITYVWIIMRIIAILAACDAYVLAKRD